MWWPLFEVAGKPPRLASDQFNLRFEPVVLDIESLNQRAVHGTTEDQLEVTAISCACYPRVASRYEITACGASVGDGYGPKLVAREAMTLEALQASSPRIAVPGVLTTACMVTTLMFGRDGFEPVVVPFQEIANSVAAGDVDAGVVIHEGQLTFATQGLHLVEDLGAWWSRETGLMLPLGANAIRRDLDTTFEPGVQQEVLRLLEASVRYALDHRAESIEYALDFARDMGAALADTFVQLYVNQWTLDFGERGHQSVIELLARAADAGLTDPIETLRFATSR